MGRLSTKENKTLFQLTQKTWLLHDTDMGCHNPRESSSCAEGLQKRGMDVACEACNYT